LLQASKSFEILKIHLFCSFFLNPKNTIKTPTHIVATATFSLVSSELNKNSKTKSSVHIQRQ
jgi:hypothetical protein